ncbi:MAG: hypothetical protein WC759_00025 [Candidatus Micrarchaeia archaeon]
MGIEIDDCLKGEYAMNEMTGQVGMIIGRKVDMGWLGGRVLGFIIRLKNGKEVVWQDVEFHSISKRTAKKQLAIRKKR